MANSHHNIAFLFSALGFLFLFGFASAAKITVVGNVYCDTCRCQFETRISYPLKGAKVNLECREREGAEKMTCKHDAVTDETGTYRIVVDDDHEEDICEVALVESNDPECNEINKDQFIKESAIVSLTTNDGEVEDTRPANPLGFMRKEPMAECKDVMREMGIAADGSLA